MPISAAYMPTLMTDCWANAMHMLMLRPPGERESSGPGLRRHCQFLRRGEEVS